MQESEDAQPAAPVSVPVEQDIARHPRFTPGSNHPTVSGSSGACMLPLASIPNGTISARVPIFGISICTGVVPPTAQVWASPHRGTGSAPRAPGRGARAGEESDRSCDVERYLRWSRHGQWPHHVGATYVSGLPISRHVRARARAQIGRMHKRMLGGAIAALGLATASLLPTSALAHNTSVATDVNTALN